MPNVPIDSIKVENRFRKVLGDLKPLEESIREIGLLHPIVVNSDFKLIAGVRRLEACKRLGWTELPARIVNLDDLELRGEYDENVVRLDFLPSEAVALKRALEPIERRRAEQRRLEGVKTGGRGHKKLGDNFAPSLSGKTRDRLANCVGLSHASLKKAEEIVLAAEQEPEKYSDLVEQMDKRYRSLDWVYRKLQVRREAEKLKSEPPVMPSGTYSVLSVDPPWAYECRVSNCTDRNGVIFSE
jgi:ParB-like chromosome segregation protein Spo0J